MSRPHTEARTDATPRERRRREQADRILDAAMVIVVEGGFEALSMHRLAAELELTPGALYRYHRSKEALVGALTARLVRKLADATTRALEPAEPPLARVVAIARTWRSVALAEPNAFALLSVLMADARLFVPAPGDAADAFDATSAAFAPLVHALTEAAASGQLTPGDPMRRGVLTFSLVHGVLQLRKQVHRLPTLLDLVGLVDDGVRALLLGWGASAAELEAAFAPRGAA